MVQISREQMKGLALLTLPQPRNSFVKAKGLQNIACTQCNGGLDSSQTHPMSVLSHVPFPNSGMSLSHIPELNELVTSSLNVP